MEAGYRKIHFKVYNVSPDVDPTGSGQLLEDKSAYTVLLRPVSGKGKTYTIPAEQFLIDTQNSTNTIDVVLTETMATGTYELMIDYTDSSVSDITAPALQFAICDDRQYRNDGYGVLAVVRKSGTSYANSKYEIKAFGSETAYEKEKASLGEVLIELKGEFTAKDGAVAGNGTVLQYTGISTRAGNNVMTVNDCIDVENGSLNVSIDRYGQNDQSINIDFDAKLDKTGARTVIWKSGGSSPDHRRYDL